MQTPFYHAPPNLSGLSLERWGDGPSGLLAKGRTPSFRLVEPSKRGNRTPRLAACALATTLDWVMGRFVVEQEFWDVFPQAKLGVLICTGLDNTRQDSSYAAVLAEAQQAAQKHLTAAEFSQNPVIQTWRQAFGKFKTKKGVRSSIEALLKRVHNGSGLGSINPLVDIYNAVSLRYAVPCGGEDLGTIQGDIRLTAAQGTEPFVTLGSEASEPPLPGELVYKDDAGAICRCLNWRESARTMLTPATTDAFMCMENVDPAHEAAFIEALSTLKEQIETHLGGQVSLHLLDSDDRELNW